MTFSERGRDRFHEFFWPAWPETESHWKVEGGYDPEKEDFGCGDRAVEFEWFFPNPPFERRVIAEDATIVTYAGPRGIVLRAHKRNALNSVPQFIRFPVKTQEDFSKFWSRTAVVTKSQAGHAGSRPAAGQHAGTLVRRSWNARASCMCRRFPPPAGKMAVLTGILVAITIA
jgi:hypothetical protein